jgi:hypothetical protein
MRCRLLRQNRCEYWNEYPNRLVQKSPLPLLPVNHCTQDNSVPLAADVFNVPDRLRMSRGPFIIRSVDNTISFFEGPGCLCPGEIEDEVSAG